MHHAGKLLSPNLCKNEQNGVQISGPANGDKAAWKAHWKDQEQSWRTEPEIDEERQLYLAKRRVIVPSIEQGIYPFKDIKLTRADVEWLLLNSALTSKDVVP